MIDVTTAGLLMANMFIWGFFLGVMYFRDNLL